MIEKKSDEGVGVIVSDGVYIDVNSNINIESNGKSDEDAEAFYCGGGGLGLGERGIESKFVETFFEGISAESSYSVGEGGGDARGSGQFCCTHIPLTLPPLDPSCRQL